VIPFLRMTIASARRIYCRHENPFEPKLDSVENGLALRFNWKWGFRKSRRLTPTELHDVWNFIIPDDVSTGVKTENSLQNLYAVAELLATLDEEKLNQVEKELKKIANVEIVPKNSFLVCTCTYLEEHYGERERVTVKGCPVHDP